MRVNLTQELKRASRQADREDRADDERAHKQRAIAGRKAAHVVRSYRVAGWMTQMQLAAAFKCSVSLICMVEKGTRPAAAIKFAAKVSEWKKAQATK